jgi:hypothetical protein
MTTIRDRQNMEMLDVFKNLNSQVFDRTKRQIAVFPQSVKPKTERDLTVEVNTDKSIEQLNKTFETKLGALEFLVQFLQKAKYKTDESGFRVKSEGFIKGEDFTAFGQTFQATINTGEVIPLWNQIVRYYQQQGLSRDSQEIVKVKTQELKPNLDALTYGLRKAIDYLFEEKNMLSGLALRVMELLRALSIYSMIMSQVDDGSLGLISNFELDTAYKNIFSSLSSQELDILKKSAPRGSILKTSIRNIPDFDTKDSAKRLQQIQDELGIKLPEEYSRVLRQLPIAELNKEIDRLYQEKGSLKETLKLSAKEKKYQAEMRKLDQDISEVSHELLKIVPEKTRIVREIYDLRRPDLGNIEQEEVPEEPDEPPFPVYDVNMPQDEFERMMSEYEDEYQDFYILDSYRDDVIAGNEAARVRAGLKSDDEIEEEITRLEELEKEIEPAYNKLYDEIQALGDARRRVAEKYRGLDTSFKDSVTQSLDRLDDKRRTLLKSVENKIEGIEEEEVDGGGKNVDTRGLATLRSNYGKPQSESDSESEEESSESDLDFDDSRNEHYYTKPKSMR